MLKTKLISFNIDEAKRRELPEASKILTNLERPDIIDQARLAGVAVARPTLESQPEVLRTALEAIALSFIPGFHWRNSLAELLFEKAVQDAIERFEDPQTRNRLQGLNREGLFVAGIRSEGQIHKVCQLLCEDGEIQGNRQETMKKLRERTITSHHSVDGINHGLTYKVDSAHYAYHIEQLSCSIAGQEIILFEQRLDLVIGQERLSHLWQLIQSSSSLERLNEIRFSLQTNSRQTIEIEIFVAVDGGFYFNIENAIVEKRVIKTDQRDIPHEPTNTHRITGEVTRNGINLLFNNAPLGTIKHPSAPLPLRLTEPQMDDHNIADAKIIATIGEELVSVSHTYELKEQLPLAQIIEELIAKVRTA
ncbi:MAG: hypothetical protein HQ596_01825 [Candidatus Saganbacteria bacterium]|nr:hypothetical protein [Candidatus Saganbacteria bacterium]